MSRPRAVAVLVVSAVLVAVVSPARAEDYAKQAPYAAIRWNADVPEVSTGGEWHALLAIDGVEAERIVAFCKETWPGKWRKRFEEDLVEVLSRMGKPPGKTVSLRLRDLGNGKTSTIAKVPMTEANRRAIWEATQDRERRGRDGGGGRSTPDARAVRRVERAHAERPSDEFRRLSQPVLARARADARTVSRQQAQEDLDELEWLVEHRFAYRDRKGLDYRAAFDAVRAGLPEPIGVGTFTLQVGKLLALFGDGHTGVERIEEAEGWSPFLAADAGGLVAFHPDRSGLLDARRPFLGKIDGVAVDRWIEAASLLVPRASPSFARRRAVAGLRNVNHLRRELGLPEKDEVEVELVNEGGKDAKTSTLRLAARSPVYGTWPRTSSRRLDGDLGYLRIDRMDDDERFLASIDEALDSFRSARGLVVDVRGNGGGSRDALRRILPRFMAADEKPVVVNVAAYRLEEGDDPRSPEGFLSDRSLFPAASSRWTEAERAAIERVRRGFRPEWKPPAAEFSDWHYMVIAPTLPPGVSRYSGPVVVLLDAGCFSATDIFLGALKGRPRVTLVGTASGGGSGRARGATLVHSGVAVRLSSMASFRVDGTLYDGRGVEPDVVVEPAPADLAGSSDAVLAAAVERLRMK